MIVCDASDHSFLTFSKPALRGNETLTYLWMKPAQEQARLFEVLIRELYYTAVSNAFLVICYDM